MTARTNPLPVLRGHAKTLVNGKQIDWIARLVMWGLPIAIGALSLALGWRFVAPSAVLSGIALLMGGLLSTAGVLMNLRLKLTDRDEAHQAAEDAKRNLDEAVPHVLTAALASLLSAITIIIAMNYPICPGSQTINRAFSGIIAALLTFVAVLFVATIIRLYAAYVQVNRVPNGVNGFVRRGSL
ncbi:hypothetical protein ACXVUM_05430 [Williamsia sp. SKLECPSW1]